MFVSEFDVLREDLNIEFEDKNKSAFLIEQCVLFSIQLESMTYSKGCFAGLKKALFEKYLFGTIDHVTYATNI